MNIYLCSIFVVCVFFLQRTADSVQVPRDCKLPADTGPCKRSESRFFFNPLSQLCEQFTYGGCAGNSNNFLTVQDCQRACICNLPVQPGPCRGFTNVFYFDVVKGKCKPFVYGGCGGNLNRFTSEFECNAYCVV